MIYRKLFLALAGLMLAVSGTAVAQDDEHGLINVRTTVVKPGTAPEYLEVMSQLAASRSAAGHSGVDMWQVVRGPVGTFYSVTYIDSYSVFDTAFDSGMSEGDWARWIGRITAVIDHSVLTTLRTHPELARVPMERGAGVP